MIDLKYFFIATSFEFEPFSLYTIAWSEQNILCFDLSKLSMKVLKFLNTTSQASFSI